MEQCNPKKMRRQMGQTKPEKMPVVKKQPVKKQVKKAK